MASSNHLDPCPGSYIGARYRPRVISTTHMPCSGYLLQLSEYIHATGLLPLTKLQLYLGRLCSSRRAHKSTRPPMLLMGQDQTLFGNSNLYHCTSANPTSSLPVLSACILSLDIISFTFMYPWWEWVTAMWNSAAGICHCCNAATDLILAVEYICSKLALATRTVCCDLYCRARGSQQYL